MADWITPTLEDDPEGDEAFGAALVWQRPHTFVHKRRRRWGAGKQISRPGLARDITVAEFEAVYSAADFALASGLPLDMHVTIHFGLMGFHDPVDVQFQLDRFIKCYGAYARGKFPAAWIYSIEMGQRDGVLNYHAHVALHVPGKTSDDDPDPPRRAFRRWATGYTARQMGRHVPRAIVAKGGLAASPRAHWLVVTYLLKGCDQFALMQSRRSSPDGLDLLLRDLMPWPYGDPGPVATMRRVRASHSLGPQRRLFGAPNGLEHILPQRFNALLIDVDGTRPAVTDEELAANGTVPVPTPFRSKFEDGVRDVRELYSHDFYEFMTRREPYPQQPAPAGESDCLTCQLRAMTDAQDREDRKWSTSRGLLGYGVD